MKIAVASPPIPATIDDGLRALLELTAQAASQHAEILCFPESYIPGYVGMGDPNEDRSPERLERARAQACAIARKFQVALLLPMDWHFPEGLTNVVFVISKEGEVVGHQTKNQLDPTEDEVWIPGTKRFLFQLGALRFGIVICHEGFRYPETVRWAAMRGAHIIFHPHFAGSDTEGVDLQEYAHITNPYYERAMMMRALENTVYFASSNYASKYPESASAIIAPDGTCIVHEAYRRVGTITADIDLTRATGLLAKRFKPHLLH